MNKGTGELHPLYMVHPIGGSVLCYSDLARSVSERKPFYAIQALPTPALQHATLEEIAASYLPLIRKQDNQGRYELGGWSFGGLLAFEMAHQAMAAGDPPARLYLFDPPALEKIELEDHSDVELAGLFVFMLVADYRGGSAIDLEALKAKFDPTTTSVEAHLRRAMELGLLSSGMDPATHLQSFEIFKRNMRAVPQYKPKKYPGETTLVLPETRDSTTWPSLLPENAAMVQVPGNHFTMLRAVSAAKIAALMEINSPER